MLTFAIWPAQLVDSDVFPKAWMCLCLLVKHLWNLSPMLGTKEAKMESYRIQSEVSQKEEKKNTVYYHIYVESRKMVQMNLFPGQE